MSIKKGDLVRHNHSGKTGTVTCDPFTKLFRDASDWEACEAGYDSATAATAITVCWHENGYTRTYKYSDFRRNFKVIPDANAQDNGSIDV